MICPVAEEKGFGGSEPDSEALATSTTDSCTLLILAIFGHRKRFKLAALIVIRVLKKFRHLSATLIPEYKTLNLYSWRICVEYKSYLDTYAWNCCFDLNS